MEKPKKSPFKIKNPTLKLADVNDPSPPPSKLFDLPLSPSHPNTTLNYHIS